MGKLIDLENAAPRGRARTDAEEFGALFDAAGFRMTRIVPHPSPLCAIEAVVKGREQEIRRSGGACVFRQAGAFDRCLSSAGGRRPNERNARRDRHYGGTHKLFTASLPVYEARHDVHRQPTSPS